eukprot:1157868-Pelagomonas_calceolata.AAC.4
MEHHSRLSTAQITKGSLREAKMWLTDSSQRHSPPSKKPSVGQKAATARLRKTCAHNSTQAAEAHTSMKGAKACISTQKQGHYPASVEQESTRQALKGKWHHKGSKGTQ